MPLTTDSAGRTYIQHANGQLTHYIHTPCTTTTASSYSKTSPSTILIQHGFALWTPWIPILSRDYNVLQRDLRGHGYSTYPSSSSSPSQQHDYTYTTATIIGEIIDLLDHLELQKVHFLGESTGGMLGEILAATHADRVLSLTIYSTPTHLPRSALSLFAFGRLTWAAALRELGSRGWAEELAKVPGTVPLSEGGAGQKAYPDEIGVSDGEGLAQYAEFLETLDARPLLTEITCPMLILAPMGSAAVRVEDMQALKEMVRGSRLVRIEGGGHEIYVTRARECQDFFLAFVGDVEGLRE